MEVAQILAEIEPVAGRLLERHMGVAKEWFPHEMAATTTTVSLRLEVRRMPIATAFEPT